MEKTEKEINNYYISRMIDSLEKDYTKWEMKYYEGGADLSWTEYHGPEYKNEAGNRIKFAFTLNADGAYVDGRMRWCIPPMLRFNPFSYQGRRLKKATKRMISHVRGKEKKEHLEKLMNSL
jgi:hypothetical protein